MAVREGIIEVLDKAQDSTVHHPRLLKSLRALHDQTDLEEFLEAFVTPLCAALVVVKKEPVVERVLEFVAKFAASVAPLDPTLQDDGEERVGEAVCPLHIACFTALSYWMYIQRAVMVRVGRVRVWARERERVKKR